MSGQLEARPPNAPPAATPGLGIQPGQSRVVIANYVIVFGPSGSLTGVFVYDPSPAAGNLIASIAAAGGTDPYTNTYLAGVTVYGPVPGGTVSQRLAAQLNAGVLNMATAPTADGSYTSFLSAQYSTIGGAHVTISTISTTELRILSGGTLELGAGANTWLAEELLAYVPANEQKTSDTTLAEDTYLAFTTLQPSAVYDVQGLFIFDAASGVNFKWSYAIGGTGDRFHGAHIYNSTGGTFGPATDLYTASASNVHAAQTTAAGTIHSIWLSGTYETAAASGSPGVFGLMWAQNSSSSSALTLHEGSKLTLRRIA